MQYSTLIYYHIKTNSSLLLSFITCKLEKVKKVTILSSNIQNLNSNDFAIHRNPRVTQMTWFDFKAQTLHYWRPEICIFLEGFVQPTQQRSFYTNLIWNAAWIKLQGFSCTWVWKSISKIQICVIYY